MTCVVDASVVIAALVDSGPIGRWAEDRLGSGPLVAPHLLPVEAANVLRRAERYGDLTTDVASLAHQDLLELRVDLYPYEPFARRIWELRASVTTYDAWYVAIAESLGVALATMDERLASAPGLRCSFDVPAG